MRAVFLTALFSLSMNVAAFADEHVAGNWHADLGSGVTINMNVSPDGKWSSETFQKKQIVRQMQGTYKQQSSNAESGTIVFTPTKYTVQSGKVQAETDKYEVAENGKQLKLTSGGDTMVFEKHE